MTSQGLRGAAIDVTGLVKRFGNLAAVDSVDFRVEPGEIFFLLGPSGCGKTTVLRCIAGFWEPDAGMIRIGDRDVTRVPPHQRDTGMVFQSYALWPHMSVEQNVGFGLEMRGLGKAELGRRVGEVLELVHMSDKARSRPNELSGGQQQRVALARALVVHPQCLLLDEPLSNLDAKLRLEMRGEIRRICKEAGLTAVYVTHDQKEALSIADRLLVLDRGRVQQVGAPREVYRAPSNRFVAGFIGEANFLEGQVESVDRGRAAVRFRGLRLLCALRPGQSAAPGAAVTVCVRPEAVRIGSPPADAENRFDGIVHDTVYLGEVAQHQVELNTAEGGSLPLKVFDLNPRIVARDEPEPVGVWVDPEDAIVLDGQPPVRQT